ncbi:MAG TPA: hypothetical protein PKG93_01670 [Bacilli bacterium]|nr:hypothetical protein [Bacilli bacterium]HPZ24014.1 hypothetical protein [Bacilli bacterium]
MNNTTIDKFIKHMANEIKKAFKTKIRDVYPNINYERDARKLIMDWYVNELALICEQAIKKYPLKHLSMGWFYYKHGLALYYSSLSSKNKTFGQTIQDQDNRKMLLIKITDNDDNIYLYYTSPKLSRYERVDIRTKMGNKFYNISHVSLLHNKSLFDILFPLITALSKDLSDKFHMQWAYSVLNESLDDVKITFDNTDMESPCVIELMIKSNFSIYEIAQMINNPNTVSEVMKEHINIFVRNANHPMQFNQAIPDDDLPMFSNTPLRTCSVIINYILSATHLLHPLYSSLVSLLADEYKEREWFLKAVEKLESDPEFSLENFFTTVKYNADEDVLELKYKNIFNL